MNSKSFFTFLLKSLLLPIFLPKRKLFSYLLSLVFTASFLSVQAEEFSLLKRQCILIDGRSFNVEVAETQEQKEKGLQLRTNLSPDSGMAFLYDRPDMLTFWMKDCKIPLDLLFFNNGILVDYVDSAPPCSLPAEECPRYSSRYLSDLVVELKAGTRKLFDFNNQSKMSYCSP